MQLHSIIDQCWEEKSILSEGFLSLSSLLYKKGSRTEVADYRLTNLLSTANKVYTTFLQNRLVSGLEGRLWSNLYSFCKDHSTTHAITLLRQIMEGTLLIKDAELHIAFPDWRTASDKVNRHGLLSAMRRTGVPEEMCKSSRGHLSRCKVCGQRLCSRISTTVQYFWHTTRLPAEPLPLRRPGDSSDGRFSWIK